MKSETGFVRKSMSVAIIGGGPGGTACALALHRLANTMDQQVKIIILEGKQFSEEVCSFLPQGSQR